MNRRLAIVGAGPKAAAVVAKVTALKAAGLSAPDVTVFDAAGPASAWTGLAGYTDGHASLCTEPERDVGFPYDRATFGAATALEAARYSWSSFLVHSGQYAAWVNRGRARPSHRAFAEYLGWVFERCGAVVVGTDVARLHHPGTVAGTWEVQLDGGGRHGDRFDGVLVTGSGPPLLPLAGANEQVFDGLDFWDRSADALDLLHAAADPSVTIVGSGGTAAAVALWFIRNLIGPIPIRIVGKEATLYARSAGYFEARVFGDDAIWDAMSEDGRATFLRRLTAGVVWQDVSDALGGSDNVSYVSGEAIGFEARDGEFGVLLRGATSAWMPSAVIVDCRGFDRWWVSSLLSGPLERSLAAARAAGRIEVDASFSLMSGFPASGLHVPGLASAAGPAANNLMALGWMADRVLRPYLPPEELPGNK